MRWPHESGGKRPIWQAAVIGAALLAVVAVLDVVTGPNVAMGSFYILPVCVVAWWGGRWPGVVAAVAATAAWVAVKSHVGILFHTRAQEAINAVLRTAFNVAVAVALAAWRDVGRRLESMVAARTAELHVLAADLSAAEDAQRRQLAHDIHDALGQNLSLLRIHLQSLARECAMESRFVTEINRIDALIGQTRTLTFELYPPMLEDLGLLAALEGYADEFRRRTGAEVTVSQVGVSPPAALAPPVAHYLFRSVRELMGNAVKHGRAEEVVVGVHWQPSSLRLTVDDDGAGFGEGESSDTPRRGLGLAAIRQRLTAMGGTMEVESQKSQGARVILQLPLTAVGN